MDEHMDNTAGKRESAFTDNRKSAYSLHFISLNSSPRSIHYRTDALCCFVFTLIKLHIIYAEDAPKWKLLAETKQNETLGRRPNKLKKEKKNCDHYVWMI